MKIRSRHSFTQKPLGATSHTQSKGRRPHNAFEVIDTPNISSPCPPLFSGEPSPPILPSLTALFSWSHRCPAVPPQGQTPSKARTSTSVVSVLKYSSPAYPQAILPHFLHVFTPISSPQWGLPRPVLRSLYPFGLLYFFKAGYCVIYHDRCLFWRLSVCSLESNLHRVRELDLFLITAIFTVPLTVWLILGTHWISIDDDDNGEEEIHLMIKMKTNA